jgi:hypothetical protein
VADLLVVAILEAPSNIRITLTCQLPLAVHRRQRHADGAAGRLDLAGGLGATHESRSTSAAIQTVSVADPSPRTTRRS